MLNPEHPVIKLLVEQGYRLAAHAYLQDDGRVKHTFVATHRDTGRVVQGWSGGGDAEAALADLARRADARGVASRRPR